MKTNIFKHRVKEAPGMLNFAEIKELIKILDKSAISDVEISSDKNKLVLRKSAMVAPAIFASTPAMALSSAPEKSAAPAAPSKDDMSQYHAVKSPMVGTYYDGPKPGAPPFVKEEEKITQGKVVCIVEAMKIMNEIQSDADGVIVKKCVKNEQPVEYGQVLFYIRKDLKSLDS